MSSADATPEIQEIEETLAPLMSAHQDSIQLDAQLYWRVKTVHEQLDELDLEPEQRYLVERHYREMSHAGAGLDDAAKETLTALNQRLSTLTTTFEKNLLNDTNDLAVVFDDVAELDGLTEGELSAAAQAAADRGLDGKWVVTLTLFTGHPYLSSLTNRASRKRILDASRARGSRGNEHDNRAVLLEIVRLRAERAALLGYDTPRRVHHLRRDGRLPRGGARPAPQARRARGAQRARASRRRCRRSSTPSPSRSRSRRTTGRSTPRRCAPPSTTSTAARCAPGSRRSACCRTASSAPRRSSTASPSPSATDLSAYHPDARVFEVHNADGSRARPVRPRPLHARHQARRRVDELDRVAVAPARHQAASSSTTSTCPKPAPGMPTLLTLDEVTTLFHEFGHALHGLFATVTYPHFAGTNVFRDFVEFPSQVNEMWIYWPEVLADYARHVETGEPLPARGRREAARLRGLQPGLRDERVPRRVLARPGLALAHRRRRRPPTSMSPRSRQPLSPTSDSTTPPCRRATRRPTSRTCSRAATAPGYYSYIWSEVLDADTVEWFHENGGLTRENGDRFRDRLLGVGGSKDPLEAYRDFRGRDAEIEPLLERRGLVA